jgi:hypothetical protein
MAVAPPAERPSLSRIRFRRSRTPAFRAGVRGWLGDRVGETRRASRQAPVTGSDPTRRYGSDLAEVLCAADFAANPRPVAGRTGRALAAAGLGRLGRSSAALDGMPLSPAPSRTVARELLAALCQGADDHDQHASSMVGAWKTSGSTSSLRATKMRPRLARGSASPESLSPAPSTLAGRRARSTIDFQATTATRSRRTRRRSCQATGEIRGTRLSGRPGH